MEEKKNYNGVIIWVVALVTRTFLPSLLWSMQQPHDPSTPNVIRINSIVISVIVAGILAFGAVEYSKNFKDRVFAGIASFIAVFVLGLLGVLLALFAMQKSVQDKITAKNNSDINSGNPRLISQKPEQNDRSWLVIGLIASLLPGLGFIILKLAPLTMSESLTELIGVLFILGILAGAIGGSRRYNEDLIGTVITGVVIFCAFAFLGFVSFFIGCVTAV